MNEIIQIGNIRDDTRKFRNPQCGRVYSIKGLAPTINTCQGETDNPKLLLR
jgi:hypothetical protein